MNILRKRLIGNLCVCAPYFKMVYFSPHFFSDRKKKTLDYSLWFLSKFDEMMTSPNLFKKDIMQKPFLIGAEWRLFQRRSIFQ